MNRPTEYDHLLGVRIAARLANDERLAMVCLDEDMPPRALALSWLAEPGTDDFKVCALWASDERSRRRLALAKNPMAEIVRWTPEAARGAIADYEFWNDDEGRSRPNLPVALVPCGEA